MPECLALLNFQARMQISTPFGRHVCPRKSSPHCGAWSGVLTSRFNNHSLLSSSPRSRRREHSELEESISLVALIFFFRGENSLSLTGVPLCRFTTQNSAAHQTIVRCRRNFSKLLVSPQDYSARAGLLRRQREVFLHVALRLIPAYVWE